MDNMELIELIRGGIGVVSSSISAIVGALITTLFLRKDTKALEFEKIKAAKFGEVIAELLSSGKMSYLEYYKCNNFLKIAKKADNIKIFEDKDSDKQISYDFDWFVRFYDYASCVSNEDMQEIWASILAREVSKPGTNSISLLHSLSMMSKEQAQFFCNISRFALRDIKDNIPLLLLFVSSNRQAYKSSGITPDYLKELERLGLLDCDFSSEFIFLKKKMFRTGNRSITVYGDPNNEQKIKAGNVIFTKDGQSLYSVIDDSYKEYRSDILDFTVSKFKSRNCRVIINDREI